MYDIDVDLHHTFQSMTQCTTYVNDMESHTVHTMYVPKLCSTFES